MLKHINRDQVLSLARELANKIKSDGVTHESVVITGMDASGKSTIIKELFPDFLTFKFDTNLSDAYIEGSSDITWLCDYFQIFDRHPYVDWFVYTAARSKDAGLLKRYIDLAADKIRNIDNVIIFLNDKYFSVKPHEGEWVAENRDTIRDYFIKYANLVKDIIDVYLVED